jgi:hypothetical protein
MTTITIDDMMETRCWLHLICGCGHDWYVAPELLAMRFNESTTATQAKRQLPCPACEAMPIEAWVLPIYDEYGHLIEYADPRK